MGFYFWEVAKMPKAKEFERRDFLFEVRAEQDEEKGSILTGRPIVYNSWTDLGWYDEMIAAGALAKADLTDSACKVQTEQRKQHHAADAG